MELNFMRMKEIGISVVYVKLYKKMQQHVSNQPGISFYHQLTQDPPCVCISSRKTITISSKKPADDECKVLLSMGRRE